ncbi:MAG: hypothetical protein HQM07_03985 [Zetaproteobacteria bacterium]|nr:hypothetical protein [Zetaproteobacteria bacterium]
MIWLRTIGLSTFLSMALLLITSPVLMATSFVAEQSYFSDSTMKMNIEDVTSIAFTPYQGALNQGYSESVLWVKIRIDPRVDLITAAGENELMVLIRPTYLDDITLFDPTYEKGMVARTGDKQHWSDHEISLLSYNFVIPRGEVPRDIWLRIDTTSAQMVSFDVTTVNGALKINTQQHLLTAMFVGLCMFALGWALIQFLVVRDWALFLLFLNQWMSLAYMMVNFGYVRFILVSEIEPVWIDFIANVIVVSTLASAVAFHMVFLRGLGASSLWVKILLLLLLAFPLELLLIFLGETRLAMVVNVVVVFVLPIVNLLAAWSVKENPKTMLPLSRALLRFFYLFLWGVLLLYMVPFIGLYPGSEISYYIPSIASVLSGLGMVLMMQYRSYSMGKQREELLMQLAASREEVAQERKFHHEKISFLDMLTHELRTPLSSLKLLLSMPTMNAHSISLAERSVNDMNHIIEHCALAGRLEDHNHRFVLSNERVSVATLLDSLGMVSEDERRVQIHLASDLVDVYTELQQCRIVLRNLLDNGLKYARIESDVHLYVREEVREGRKGVVFEVENEPGMAGFPDPELVFIKYYRHKGARRKSGSGLGLYLATQICYRLGIELQYVPNEKVVRFVLWIPACTS